MTDDAGIHPERQVRRRQRAAVLRGIGRVIALVAAAMAASVAMASPAGNELIGAASAEHLWLIVEPGKSEETFALAHHPADEPTWNYRVQHMMSQAPAMMAAWGDRVWLVHPPRLMGGGSTPAATGPAATQPGTNYSGSSRGWQREVHSCQVVKNAATGLYYTLPTGRLEMLPPLPGLGKLAGFAATREGPVALLLPTGRASATITAGGDSAASEPFLDRAMLLRLEPGKSTWTEIPLPSEFDAARPALLAAFGLGDRQLVLLNESSRAAATGDNARRFVQQADASWSGSSVGIDVRRVRTLASMAGQLAAVISDRSEDVSNIVYLRPGGLLPLASLPRIEGKSLIVGFGDRLLLIERERGGGAGSAGGAANGRLNVRVIDPLTGQVAPAEAFVSQPLTAGRLWQMAFIIGLALTAVLLVMVLRPSPATSISVDPQAVLPAFWRLLAALVDFVIGAVPAMLLLDCSPVDLLTLPVVTFDIARCGPYLLAAAIATTFATLGEALSGKSVGKALVGGTVAALDGSAVATWRIVVRGVTRFIVLALPPLAIFVLLNPYMQGLHDWAARTLVLRSDWREPTKPGDHEPGTSGE
jgi:uncharacterized RDD family membrane protein YckC